MVKSVLVALGAALIGLPWSGRAIAASPGDPAPGAQTTVPKKRPPAPPLGLRVEPLDADAARALGTAGGVRVVHAVGTAFTSGLRNGDVIFEVNGVAVASADAFWDAVAAANWQPTLGVLRAGKRVSVRLAKSDTP